MTDSIQKHFQQLRRWMEMEADAERERLAQRLAVRDARNAERSGETLLDLVLIDYDAGLGGRQLVTFAKRNRSDLPWNRFRVGSPVIASDDADPDQSQFGVVSRRTQQTIQVAFDDWPQGEHFRLDLSADEVSRKRQAVALSAATQARGRVGQLRDVLLGEREPRFHPSALAAEPSGLNAAQQAAIEHALAAQDLAIIHGPPGTGKTTTVVELVRQAVGRGLKVLACAPSNTAVDNLLERMVRVGLKVVRIGHPARVHEILQDHTLDAQVENDPAMKHVRGLLREAEQTQREAERFRRAKPLPGQKRELRQEAKQLRDDARRLERQIVQAILDRADVICATTTFDPESLGERRFDLVVIDEACQSTEPGCWPAILRADRVVLAGDHRQLPPTLLSVQAAREGFAISLMERLVNTYGDLVTRQLTVQYRMHTSIMQFSSKTFYEQSLQADASVASHLLEGLPSVSSNPFTATPIHWIDTAGADWREEQEPDGESRLNPQEGRLVLRYIDALVKAGVLPTDIAVIAPYAAQVRWLKRHSKVDCVEIDSVDGFQGREKEAVIITLVRSNQNGEIGFLGDTRRMNVALTRARRRLIVIGDSSTLSGHAFYANLLEYFESEGGYATVWDPQWGLEES